MENRGAPVRRDTKGTDPNAPVSLAQRERIRHLATGHVDRRQVLHQRVEHVEARPVFRQNHAARRAAGHIDLLDDLRTRFVDHEDPMRERAEIQGAVAGGDRGRGLPCHGNRGKRDKQRPDHSAHQLTPRQHIRKPRSALPRVLSLKP